MCNELYNGEALEAEIIKLVQNGDEGLILKDSMPKYEQRMFENELTEEISPSDVYLMLCWRHICLTGYYFDLYHQNMDPIEGVVFSMP